MKTFIRKLRIPALTVSLTVLMASFVSASSAAGSSSQPEVYGSMADYIWLIAALLVGCIFVFRKLGQLNAKNKQNNNPLQGRKNKHR